MDRYCGKLISHSAEHYLFSWGRTLAQLARWSSARNLGFQRVMNCRGILQLTLIIGARSLFFSAILLWNFSTIFDISSRVFPFISSRSLFMLETCHVEKVHNKHCVFSHFCWSVFRTGPFLNPCPYSYSNSNHWRYAESPVVPMESLCITDIRNYTTNK